MSMGKSSGRGSVPEYGVTVDEGVMIPLRDGIRCASDIYFPAGANTSPSNATGAHGTDAAGAYGNTGNANANAGQNTVGINGVGGEAAGEFPVIMQRTPYDRKEGAGIGK